MNVKLSHDEALYTFVRIQFEKMNPHVRVKRLYPRDPGTKLGNWLGGLIVAVLVILAVKGPRGEGINMSKFEWVILVSIFIVGFVVGVLAAPDPCMYPPVERTMPQKHPGIGG